MKRICKNCLFLAQDWHLDWKKDEQGDIQQFLQLDNYCTLYDVFKDLNGYCDCWEEEAQAGN